MPAHGFGVGLAGRSLGGGDFGKFKPGMLREKSHEALADDASSAEHAGAPLCSVVQRGHAAPPHCAPSLAPGARPMRVPRTCGRKVLRIHTVISVSAASG